MTTQNDSLNPDFSSLKILVSNLLSDLKVKGVLNLDKNYSNVLDIVNDLTPEQFLCLRNEDYFKHILKSLRVDSIENYSNTGNTFNGNHASYNQAELPSPETEINSVYFGNEIDRLITKINNIKDKNKGLTYIHTLSDVLTMSRKKLSNISGVGRKYVDLWLDLKSLYPNNVNITSKPNTESPNEPIAETDMEGMNIIYSALSDSEKKCLERLIRMGMYNNVSDLMKITSKEIIKNEGVGKIFVDCLMELKDRVSRELTKIANGDIDYMRMESELIMHSLSVNKQDIDGILLEDIDNYLDKISDIQQDVFQSRWGFVEPELTLEELGLRHGLTRERIRQIETKVNNNLIRSLRLTPGNIWRNIKDDINLKLSENMKVLSACFDKEKNFYDFLEYITGGKEIQKFIRPDIDLDMLNEYFAKNGSPRYIDQVKEYIQHECELDESNVDNTLLYLDETVKIEIKDDKVYPRNLKKNEAAACVLCDHPKGLPWKDIAKIVNIKNISKTNINESRPDNQALFDSDFVFLSGKGTYKHTKFVNFVDINFDSVFSSILDYYDETNREVFHLNEAYQKSSLLKKYDYFIIRYIVKMYGEDYGFYFDGKSQVDSVGIEKNFKNITQKDVILQEMHTSGNPMTKAEIASILKSKSLGHAAYYLDNMINDGQIVQVDRMLYTTLDIAYKNINIKEYIAEIQKVLLKEHRPVDPSFFKKILNKSLNVSYSKYFYAAIAKSYSKKNNWHRNQNLYSLKEIRYKNLTDAINMYCKRNLDSGENYKILINYVAITKDSAISAIGNWKHTPL